MTKTPVQILTECGQATAGGIFNVYHGRKPDQNFDIDEIADNFMLFDPVKMAAKPVKTNIDVWNVTFTVFIGYKSAPDATQAEKITLQQNAMAVAREFYLRIRAYDQTIVKEMGDKTMDMVESLFDLNLCGVLMTSSFVMYDASSTCLS